MLNQNTYPIKTRTDRDVEVPNLLDFLTKHKGKYETLLDVGGQCSAQFYANDIRPLVKTYDALDPLPDKEVEKIADHYFTEDFLTKELKPYDMVICVSTIEHVGMYPFVYANRVETRDKFFQKLLKIANKYLFLSFPVGQPYEIANEMSIIPPEQCENWIQKISKYKNEVGFFFSEGPQAGYPWRVSSKLKNYNGVYIESLGNRSICIMEVEK